jgi:hypothetical protein
MIDLENQRAISGEVAVARFSGCIRYRRSFLGLTRQALCSRPLRGLTTEETQ